MNDLMNDLLNLSPDDFIDKKTGGFFTDPNLFTIDMKKSQGDMYKAVIRFLPWYKNPSNMGSKYKKFSVILTHPVTNEKLYVDCPSTDRTKSSILWTLDLLLRDKKKAEIDIDLVEQIKKWFNRFYNYYSPIYVIKDPQVPENDGKIFIYAYGSQIEAMQEVMLNPTNISGLAEQKKINPFSLIEGKDYILVAKKKNKFGKDYSASKFMDAVTPFRFKYVNAAGETVQHVCRLHQNPEENKKENKLIFDFLKNNTPNLENYYLKEWDDATYKKVAEFLKAIIPYKEFMAELLSKSRDEKMKQLLTSTSVSIASEPAKPESKQQASKPPIEVPKDNSIEEYLEFNTAPESTEDSLSANFEDVLRGL